jgi:hypothetical protein
MEKFRAWIFLAAGLFLGLLVGHFGKEVFNLTWKSEVGLGDVLNFVNTIIFAFLLQQYFQKRFGDKRVEKDHIISLIKEANSWLENSRSKFVSCYDKGKITKADEQEVKALIRNLANSLEEIKVSLKECKYANELNYFEQSTDSLYLEYKRNITGGNFPAKPYDGNDFNEEETTYQKLRSKLLSFIFKINTI